MQEESAISKWCAFDLFLSQDFARSWKNLTAESNGRIASFWDFEWGASLERRKVQRLPLPGMYYIKPLAATAAEMHSCYFPSHCVRCLPAQDASHGQALGYHSSQAGLLGALSKASTTWYCPAPQDDPFPDQTILATVYESTAKLKGPYPGWDKDMHFVVSQDFFKSKPRNLVPCGNQFEVRGPPYCICCHVAILPEC